MVYTVIYKFFIFNTNSTSNLSLENTFSIPAITLNNFLNFLFISNLNLLITVKFGLLYFAPEVT